MASRAVVRALLVAALLAAPAATRAAVTTYTSRAAFDAAIAGLVPGASLDFESIDAGTVIPSGGVAGDFGFQYAIAGGVELVVVGGLATTSGDRSLGTVGDLTLLAGDAFALSFPAATAIGLHVIGEDLLPGDVELQTVAGTVALGAPEQTLSDGAQAYFLGVVESHPLLGFDTAELVSFVVEDVGDFVWNVDDLVTAPEPAGAGACAALALGALSRRRRGAPRPARAASRPGR